MDSDAGAGQSTVTEEDFWTIRDSQSEVIPVDNLLNGPLLVETVLVRCPQAYLSEIFVCQFRGILSVFEVICSGYAFIAGTMQLGAPIARRYGFSWRRSAYLTQLRKST